jgi:hypothetical protein
VVLARRAQDGTTTPLPGKYVSAIEFRDGRAAVTRDRELHLVSADGSTSVLAQQVDGLPSQASDGALVYAARFGASVEIYWLSTNGNNRRLASFAGSATRLSPRADTAVVFVGAKSGGVSGIWIANAKGARCLTNCKLGAGRPWTDGYRPPPGDTGTVRIFADRVEWQDAEGRAQVAPLGEKP